MTRHKCTEYDETFNPYTKEWECIVCGKVFTVPVKPLKEAKK